MAWYTVNYVMDAEVNYKYVIEADSEEDAMRVANFKWSNFNRPKEFVTKVAERGTEIEGPTLWTATHESPGDENFLTENWMGEYIYRVFKTDSDFLFPERKESSSEE